MNARVLVVDDERDIRQLVSIKLRKDGYDVRSAENGLQAIEMALAQPVDVILLDVSLPDLDGLEVCRRLRGRLGSRTPRIAFLSARGQESDIRAGLEAGGDDYIVKPFRLSELAGRLRTLLEC
ncbi:MAG: response regulator [Chloroflexi bacterium]|nr:response regulator [Chloroflexota bacterium]